MKRRICIVSGTRAEYGLLRGVIEGVQHNDPLELQMIVTGTHLSPEFGLTYREIEADGTPIDDRVEILLSSDTAAGVAKAMGLGLIGFADAFARLKPHILVLLGDRFEILAAAAAAMVAAIPIAHIHGGETSEGAFDEAIRHSLTKMSHLHFVAAEPYRKRVVQLGEDPGRVFLVGGLGTDAIQRERLLEREALEQSLGLTFGLRNLLITYHPETLNDQNSCAHLEELLNALDMLDNDTRLIFTMPNADTGGRALMQRIGDFVADRPNSWAYASLGQRRYLSCLRFVDGVIGNSSSGLAEAPSFGIGTLNIGDRQAGRLKASSVIDCPPRQADIEAGLSLLFSPDFKSSLSLVRNPYGDGGASARIVEVLRTASLEGLLKKRFYDLPVE